MALRQVVNAPGLAQRDMAMECQNHAPCPHMSVDDNMADTLTIAKQAKADIDMHVRKTTNFLERGVTSLFVTRTVPQPGGAT